MKMTNKTATRVGNPITLTTTRRFVLTNEIVRYDGDTGVAGGKRDRYNLVTQGGYMAGGFSLAERRILSSQGWPLAVGEKITKERARQLSQAVGSHRGATLSGRAMAKAIERGASDSLEAILQQARGAGFAPRVFGTLGDPPAPVPEDPTIPAAPSLSELKAAAEKAAGHCRGHRIGTWTDHDKWSATACEVCSAALVVGMGGTIMRQVPELWGAARTVECGEFLLKMGLANDGEPDAGLGTPAPAPVTVEAAEDDPMVAVDHAREALVTAIAEAVAQAIASRGIPA